MLEVVALSKAYHQQQVLRDITFSVPAGQLAVVFGANGEGKTVLLKLIAGLLTPDSGCVRVDGHDLLQEREQALARMATFLNGMQLVDNERLVGVSLPRSDAGAARFLPELDLEAYHDVPLGLLSQGLRQQVALARVLAAGRPILLLDEPLRGLDRRAADAVQGWVQHLVREQGRAVVLATCDPRPALEMGERLLFLRRGGIVADIPLDRSARLDQPAYYRIRVQGGLDARWSTWFDGLTVAAGPEETVLSGLLLDQPALHSVLTRIRDLGLPLLSVQRFSTGVEEIMGG
jgi:ABC-type multidrug transport system ATPase subunit